MWGLAYILYIAVIKYSYGISNLKGIFTQVFCTLYPQTLELSLLVFRPRKSVVKAIR